jgi:hypothetical protein
LMQSKRNSTVLTGFVPTMATTAITCIDFLKATCLLETEK